MHQSLLLLADKKGSRQYLIVLPVNDAKWVSVEQGLEDIAANHRCPFFQDDVFGPQGQQTYTMDPHRKVGLNTLAVFEIYVLIRLYSWGHISGEKKSLALMTASVSKVPTINGQMGPPGRPQMSQAPMARHPSREQLIDYLMLKVSQQPQGPPRIPQDTVQQEVKFWVFFFFFYWLHSGFTRTVVCCLGIRKLAWPTVFIRIGKEKHTKKTLRIRGNKMYCHILWSWMCRYYCAVHSD